MALVDKLLNTPFFKIRASSSTLTNAHTFTTTSFITNTPPHYQARTTFHSLTHEQHTP